MKTFGLGLQALQYLYALLVHMDGWISDYHIIFRGKMWDERKDHSSKKHCDNYREAKLLYEKTSASHYNASHKNIQTLSVCNSL